MDEGIADEPERPASFGIAGRRLSRFRLAEDPERGQQARNAEGDEEDPRANQASRDDEQRERVEQDHQPRADSTRSTLAEDHRKSPDAELRVRFDLVNV